VDLRRSRLLIGALAALLTLGACGGGGNGGTTGSDAWAKATSAEQGGGLEKLIAAAKAEGKLNVITLPRDWANYGELLDTFSKKYGIQIASANPQGTSQDEITAVKRLGKQDRAPDVLDLGQSFAEPNKGLFAPYQVSTWSDIPAENKDSVGAWVNDYGGYISIGCNADLVATCPATFAELTQPQYKGKVALNGDPTKAAAAFSGVFAASLANGGSFDDISKGVEFFGKLAKSGNFLKLDPTPATIESGQSPIVIDWDYLNAAQAVKLKGKLDWKVAVPADGLVAQYYVQAINKNAPHPAAARLWQEFLYSDEGQNLWLKGQARPIRLPAMEKAGTADEAALAALPSVRPGEVEYPSQAQVDKANEVVLREWASAVS
jgi:putative spermidine/putrescine transport system substrate-binding protein